MNLTVTFWLLPLITIPTLLLGAHAWPRLNRIMRVGLMALVAALITFYGLQLAQAIRTNITQLPEWDFSFFWLNGQVAARGLNFYDPVQYQQLARQFLPHPPTIEFQQAVLDVGFWYPPPSMFLFLPLGWFSLQTAASLWFAFHVLVLLADVGLVWQLFLHQQKYVGAMLALVLMVMMTGTQLTFSYAQTNALLLLFVLLFYKERGRPRAGVWLALAILVKPIALVLGLVLVLHRQWRILGITAIVLALITLAAWLVFGTDVFRSFITAGPTARQPLWVYTEPVNQSLLSYILRLTQSGPLTGSPVTNPIFVGLTALMLAFSAWLIWRLGRGQSGWAIAVALSLGMLIYPATLNHYSLLLILPLGVVWQARTGPGRWRVGFTACFIGGVFFWMGYRDGNLAFMANLFTWIRVCEMAWGRSGNNIYR